MEIETKRLIDKVLGEYIDDFNKKKNLSFVVKDSIPIVWFGDIDKYFSSPKKILTVGLNPSEQEFMKKDIFGEMVALSKSEQRFEQIELSHGATETNIAVLKNTLNDYFKVNPYKWFNKYNKLLETFDCSYGGKYGELKNTAIHIDLYSAIATTPTWGKLDNCQKDLLKNIDLFKNFLKLLNPNLVLVSVNKETFESTFSRCRKIGAFKYLGNNSLTMVECDCRIVINGTNMQGTPFGGIKEEKVKEVLSNVKNFCFYKRCGCPEIECSVGYLVDAGLSVQDILRKCHFYHCGYCNPDIDAKEDEFWEKCDNADQ